MEEPSILGCLVAFVLWFVFWGGIGHMIGKPREAERHGFWLGVLFGPLGWLLTLLIDCRAKCPFCQGRVYEKATACLHCGRAITVLFGCLLGGTCVAQDDVAAAKPHKWANVAERILNDPTFKPESMEGKQWIAQQERKETAEAEKRAAAEAGPKKSQKAAERPERRSYNRPRPINPAMMAAAQWNRAAMARTMTPYWFVPPHR